MASAVRRPLSQLLVDSQPDKIKAAIAEISDQPVQFVINSHYHYDHTDGNDAGGPEPGMGQAFGNLAPVTGPEHTTRTHQHAHLGIAAPPDAHQKPQQARGALCGWRWSLGPSAGRGPEAVGKKRRWAVSSA